MCDILVIRTHIHTQAPNHIAKHNDIPLTHSGTLTHRHTHTQPSLQVDLNHIRGRRNGLSVQIKSVFLRIKRHSWWWHFASPLQTQMPKHHSVTSSLPLARARPRGAHTRAVNPDPPGGILNKAEVIRMFLRL